MRNPDLIRRRIPQDHLLFEDWARREGLSEAQKTQVRRLKNWKRHGRLLLVPRDLKWNGYQALREVAIGSFLLVILAGSGNAQNTITLPPSESMAALRSPQPEPMTYKRLWAATKARTVLFVKRCKPTAENMRLNYESGKKTVKASVPYLAAVCSVTGIVYNINNWKIRN